MIALAGLDLSDRLVVCVGGGSVAERRIARLRAAGARVRLIAPVATAQLTALAAEGAIEWPARVFEPTDLDDAWFCHTATGSASVDASVVAAAEARRVWCVNAGHGGKGTARLAAETTSGDVMVGVVSTAGADPRRTVAVRDAIVTSCRVRLRPVLMTSLATIIGLLPMALKLGEGSESYAPLARALICGLTLSVIVTVFIVPVGFYLAYRNRRSPAVAV